MTIPSNIDELPKVEEFVAAAAEKSGIEHHIATNIILAVNEATVNAIVHGNKLDENKTVSIDIKSEPGVFVVVIKDQGKGFDPASVPDPTNPENLFKESGRGLYIMKSCISSVDYKFTPGGTELTLVMKTE